MYCCNSFKEAIESYITEIIYPSGKEYYVRTEDTLREQRIYYCPFCGENLE